MADNQDDIQHVAKPKRAKTGYFFFLQARRPGAMEAHRAKNGGKCSMGDLGKELGALWNKASEEEKAKYEALAAEEKKRHDAETKEYEEKTKIEGLMTKPQSPYFAFNTANREKIMKEHDITGISQVSKKCKELWNKMSLQEKQPFEEKYRKDKFAYEEWMESKQGKAALAKQTKMKAVSGAESAKAKKQAKREEKATKRKDKLATAEANREAKKEARQAKEAKREANAKKRAAKGDPAANGSPTSPAEEAPPAKEEAGAKKRGRR